MLTVSEIIAVKNFEKAIGRPLRDPYPNDRREPEISEDGEKLFEYLRLATVKKRKKPSRPC